MLWASAGNVCSTTKWTMHHIMERLNFIDLTLNTPELNSTADIEAESQMMTDSTSGPGVPIVTQDRLSPTNQVSLKSCREVVRLQFETLEWKPVLLYGKNAEHLALKCYNYRCQTTEKQHNAHTESTPKKLLTKRGGLLGVCFLSSSFHLTFALWLSRSG